MLPFVEVEGTEGEVRYEADRRRAPPQRVPLASLGARVKMAEAGEHEGRRRYSLAARCPDVGGDPLQPLCLESMFAAGRNAR